MARKEKQFLVDKKSLAKAQEKLNKLRPIRDALDPIVRVVPGFSGLILSSKVVVYCCNEESIPKLNELVRKYRKHVDIKLVLPMSKGRMAGQKPGQMPIKQISDTA